MLALDPNETWEYSLVGDREKAKPPRFIFRYPSFRVFRACMAVVKRTDEAATAMADSGQAKDNEGDYIIDEVLRIISAHLVRIDDAPGTWGDDELDDALTLAEIWELFYAIAGSGRIAEDTRKNSPSPAVGPVGDSADAALATSESAETCPGPEKGSRSTTPPEPGPSNAAPSDT